ncbi:dnaJ homolog subfamily C member 28 [Arctopsyche grandis]|uniref:dnaJ homolog subfamily C member 28 n=1 Tax=Arctopsyche grandis TaxID=121162 RepID=UPI00406D87F3
MRCIERTIFLSLNNISKIRFSSSKLDKDLSRCYEILNVNESSDYETVRQAYLLLAKKYHPDSGSPQSDVNKFKEVESAFRQIHKKITKQNNLLKDEDVGEFDIRHTAPQHRQYLSYEGVGIGTPMQREKQWVKVKASRAAQNVMEHRIAKTTAAENALMDKNQPIAKKKHDIKTKYGFDRLVEDLIQEAMSKGEFNNLKGIGKPLPLHQNTNPYVDFVTHKMNQVLIDNGFTPEWITLQKDIRHEVEKLRSSLLKERSKLGNVPLNPSEEYDWSRCVEKHNDLVKKINSKITHYNLVVPILQKQMIFISLEKEAQRALDTEAPLKFTEDTKKDDPKTSKEEKFNIIDMFSYIFKV